MSTSIHWASEKSGNWSGPSQWRHVTGKQPTTLQTVAVASLPDSGSSSEPPSPSSLRQSIVFLVGRNSRGKWVVQDQRGRCGGLFVGRNEALKFARRENGNRPQAVIMVADTLELDLTPHEVATPYLGRPSDAQLPF